MRVQSCFKIIFAGVSLGMLSVTTLAFAHGYIMTPPGRAYLCNLGQNKDCGPVEYEPQSIEGPQGYPEAGPAEGKLASAGLSQFSALDAQSATRWSKTSIKPGAVKFVWNLTANHKTKQWRYFITKSGWDAAQKLTRSSFEVKPFCEFTDNGAIPDYTVTHNCTLPAGHKGYQVVMAVWDIADTANGFYQMVDLNFSS